MKTIFLLIPDGFCERNYLCSSFINHLKSLSSERDARIIVFSNNSKLPEYLAAYGLGFEPLLPWPAVLNGKAMIPDGYFFQFMLNRLKADFIDKLAAYRFNEINGFKKHKHKKELTRYPRNKYRQFLHPAHDCWPFYYSWLFPGSRVLLRILIGIAWLAPFVANNKIRSHFKKFRPDLLVFGNIQDGRLSPYVHYARKFGVKTIGIVGSWDQPTLNGPCFKGLTTYVATNPFMKEELVRYHEIQETRIRMGSPVQFDVYKETFGTIDIRAKFGIPTNAKIIFFPAYNRRCGPGEPIIAAHIAENIEKGCYGTDAAWLVIRSYPHDKEFEDRFGHLRTAPRTTLMTAEPVLGLDPVLCSQDFLALREFLRTSAICICGAGSVTIDASFFNLPVINIFFDGTLTLPRPLSVQGRFDVDHYNKLLTLNGARVVRSFEELDQWIIRYLENPNLDNEGRMRIRDTMGGGSMEMGSKMLADLIRNSL